ncbi:MAG TPA: potassium transporter Kup [Chitinophagaceae bacterium]|nr:potassium transporter Kup [Chitinophagaceae bacterium]
MSNNVNKVSTVGLLVALGIIFGDIGTSPLYVFNSIIKGREISEALILGALSLIIWTITMQTTVKYVIMVLRADNKGEGGIFALYALVRRRRKWLVVPAMIGGAALLADGIITPPITITSAIEGLKEIPTLANMEQSTIVAIVIGILALFFFSQQFGTHSIGRFYGPVMAVWFSVLGILGIMHISDDFTILKALNPFLGIQFLITYPEGFWILGAVFLCITGAEGLYSDLGHCGRGNIRISWIFVKSMLLLNYFGQGASLLKHHTGKVMTADVIYNDGINAFFDLMPQWFLIPGIIIATSAAIIASQAMVSGSFTLINEAIRLNLWPKMRIIYPSEAKGQLYIPGLNLLLFAGCVGVVLFFRESAKMEAAYGLAIITTMFMTTILFANFMVLRRWPAWFIYIFLGNYIIVETAFFIALMDKFKHGGYITLMIGLLMFVVMFVWLKSRKIKNRYVEFVRVDKYVLRLEGLSKYFTVPKYATHHLYFSSPHKLREI